MPVGRKNLFVSFLFTLGVTGCSSPPPQVNAEIPLIHPSLASSLNSANAIIIPEPTGMQQKSIDLEGVAYSPSETYIAATGLRCMVLQPDFDSSREAPSRRACKQDGQWQLLPLLTQPRLVR